MDREEYNTKIHENTARHWLQKLGYSRAHHKKSIYFDGHDHDDVVAYRPAYLSKMNDIESKSLTCFN